MNVASIDPNAAPAIDASLPTLDQYQLRLPAFEGPLDVLLRLIERERLAIADVSLVAVTDGFLAYIRDLNDTPPPLLAEFVAVAGRLLVLKSRALLPRPVSAADDAEPSDLARQLAERHALREAATALGELDRLGLGSFPLGAGIERPTTPQIRLARHAAVSLASALRRRLAMTVVRHPVASPPRVLTLPEMIRRFVGRLQHASPIRFSDVLSNAPTRDEALAGFLALLVMIRRKVVHASQDDLFGAIEIHLTPSPGAPALSDLLRQDSAGAAL